MADALVPPKPGPRFTSLEPRFLYLVTEPTSHLARRGATLTFSIVLHTILIAVTIIVPLLMDEILPVPGDAVQAFFVQPAEVAPPPPPPPPPAPGPRPVVQKAPPPVQQDAKFVAPVEVPEQLPTPEESLDAFGVEGGVPGGVEGGVPGGVVGGVVGGLPAEPPPPAPRVRIGGQIVAPKLLNKPTPVYPELARQARVSAVVIMEAVVGTDGRVKSVAVLRGHPLLDKAARDAVTQWRYQPLLLNGVPTEFVLTVTLVFNIANSAS